MESPVSVTVCEKVAAESLSAGNAATSPSSTYTPAVTPTG